MQFNLFGHATMLDESVSMGLPEKEAACRER